MGNFEKLGVLVIITLVVVILVLMVWGVGQPMDDLGAGLPELTPQKLVLEGGERTGFRDSGQRIVGAGG